MPPVLRLHEERTMVVNIAGRDVPATLAFVGDTLRKFDPIASVRVRVRRRRSRQALRRGPAADAPDRDFRGALYLHRVPRPVWARVIHGRAAHARDRRSQSFGARTGQIISLLAHRIVYLVLGAAAVASVLAYLVMKAWLQNFAFRAGINPLIFVGGGARAGSGSLTLRWLCNR